MGIPLAFQYKINSLKQHSLWACQSLASAGFRYSDILPISKYLAVNDLCNKCNLQCMALAFFISKFITIFIHLFVHQQLHFGNVRTVEIPRLIRTDYDKREIT